MIFTANINLLPVDFLLVPTYPNLFNPVTILNFAFSEETDVSIAIYNLQGRAPHLTNRMMDASYNSIFWNSNHHSSDLYFVQIIARNYIKTKKLMFII